MSVMIPRNKAHLTHFHNVAISAQGDGPQSFERGLPRCQQGSRAPRRFEASPMAAPAPQEQVAPVMALPVTPPAQLEPEVSVESVFGDSPTQSEADKNSDPQSI